MLHLCSSRVTGWVSALVCCGVAVCLAETVEGGATEAALYRFQQHDVVIGTAARQTVLVGFFSDAPMAELAVVDVDKDRGPRLRSWGFEGRSWARRLDTTLQSSVIFADVAVIGGRHRLLTYAPGQLSWLDPDSAKERPLVAVRSNFTPPRRGEIPHVDIARDLNHDGRDDLVLPGADGFNILVQLADGKFSEPVVVGSPTDLSRIYGADGYRYDPWAESRIFEVDYDRDGRHDLVYWSAGRLHVHSQDRRGLFAATPDSVANPVQLDSDRLDVLAEAGASGRVLHSLADLNADGVADMVVMVLEDANHRSKHSKFEVHLGEPVAGGTEFSRKPDRVIQSDDSIPFGLESKDFDGDGQGDLLVTSIERKFLKGSLWKRLKGAMGDDVWLNLEFYRGDNGVLPNEPSAQRRMALDGAPSHRERGWVPLEIVLRGGQHERRRTQRHHRRAFNPTRLIGDVNGDGRADLLLEHTFRELHVYSGVSGPGLFSAQPQRVEVEVPHDEEYTWLTDLNRDGKQDVVLHHPYATRSIHGAPKRPPGSETQRVTLLVAQ